MVMASARPRCPRCNATNLEIRHESSYPEDEPLDEAELVWSRFAACFSCAREFDWKDGHGWTPRRRPAP